MWNRHLGRSRPATMAIVALLGLVWLGCGEDSVEPPPRPSPGLEECGAANVFRRGDFYNSTAIDNKWLPLVPGTQFILDGEANWGAGLLPHRVVLTVTDLVKVIDGVPCVVLWDRDYNNGKLEEAELAFFAQDEQGNVWNLGEYPEEYENGVFVAAPNTWIAGLAGADAGIHMLAAPQVGVKYLQGWAPDINFLDCGMVFETGTRTCVPFNCYENVLVIDERSPLDVGSGNQRKYYAPGVGNVRIGAVEDPEAETLTLTNLLHLDAQLLAEARLEALKLEARAYQDTAGVYHRTERARKRP